MSNHSISIADIKHGAYGDHALAILDRLEETMDEDGGTFLPFALTLVEEAREEITDALADLEGHGWSEGAYWEIVGVPAYEKAEERAEERVAGIVAAWVILTGVLVTD